MKQSNYSVLRQSHNHVIATEARGVQNAHSADLGSVSLFFFFFGWNLTWQRDGHCLLDRSFTFLSIRLPTKISNVLCTQITEDAKDSISDFTLKWPDPRSALKDIPCQAKVVQFLEVTHNKVSASCDQVCHLFTTTVSLRRSVKNLPRDRIENERRLDAMLDLKSDSFHSFCSSVDAGCSFCRSRNRMANRAPEWPRSSVEPYRIVFTTKRVMTARPTQPHMTPITIAVTSPVRRDT